MSTSSNYQPPYTITPEILNRVAAISEAIGRLTVLTDQAKALRLRRINRVRTIHGSLAIEGNTLSEEQITAILENKRVTGPAKDIREVENAIRVYDHLDRFDPYSLESYLDAHRMLMAGLVESPGRFRTGSVGIVQGSQIAHLAPPGWNVDYLMRQLFDYLTHGDDHLLIKSCVFHYEMEFIHPFLDGNGRMGRLWQTIILMQVNPVFAYLPVEQEIRKSQKDYYDVLSRCDKEGLCTTFIEYMLAKIEISLEALVSSQRVHLDHAERLAYFLDQWGAPEFSRKDYLAMFPKMSYATATRDLRKGVEAGLLVRFGSDRLSRYRKGSA